MFITSTLRGSWTITICYVSRNYSEVLFMHVDKAKHGLEVIANCDRHTCLHSINYIDGQISNTSTSPSASIQSCTLTTTPTVNR
jgi:hypothetical protein